MITLERAVWGLPDLNARRIRLTAFEQQLAQNAMFTPPTAAPPEDTVPGCTGSLAHTIFVRDPVYGAVTLTWDGSSLWTGCIVVNFFGFGGTCPAASSVAAHYDLLNTGHFRMRWTSSDPTGTKCPQASTTCAGTPNVTATTTGPISISSCVPFRASIQVLPGQGFVIYGNAVNAGVRVDMSESPL